MTSKKDIIRARATLLTIKPFLPNSQYQAIYEAMLGEEGQHFADLTNTFADRIANMPETYGQDGKGDSAIVSLHYFMGGMDWYITERDSDPDGEGQIQAFGLADLGMGSPELGYICIPELVKHGVQLDLYFDPQPLASVKAKHKDQEPA